MAVKSCKERPRENKSGGTRAAARENSPGPHSSFMPWCQRPHPDLQLQDGEGRVRGRGAAPLSSSGGGGGSGKRSGGTRRCYADAAPGEQEHLRWA